jgi:hypothetical protein
MSGLVAGGAVMVPYIAFCFILGRAIKTFRAPDWWRVWILCAVPLAMAIPAIVMTVNDPVLPVANAAQVTAATLVGLALATVFGRVAAQRPLAYVLLMIDSLALACLMVALPALESYAGWLARGRMVYIYAHLAMVAAGVGLLVVTTVVRYWWRRAGVPSAASWFVAGLAVTYLLVPLFHHLFFCKDDGSWLDPDYFSYIPDADNYFARSALLQIGVWIVVALVTLGVTRLRLSQQRKGAQRSHPL